MTTWSLEDDHVVFPERVQQFLAEVKGGEGRYQNAGSLIRARIPGERRCAFQKTHTYEKSSVVPLPDDGRSSCQWRLTLCPDNCQYDLGQAERFHSPPAGRRRLTTSRNVAPRCHSNSVPAWAAWLIVGTTGIDAGFPPLTVPEAVDQIRELRACHGRLGTLLITRVPDPRRAPFVITPQTLGVNDVEQLFA